MVRLGVPVMVSVIIGVAAGATALPGGAQACAPDDKIGAASQQGCGEPRTDLARDDAKQVTDASADAARLRQRFEQADRDRDGRISPDEWIRWSGSGYASDLTTIGTD